jgi:hypothetical protein
MSTRSCPGDGGAADEHRVGCRIDGDPGAELQLAHGRFRYFSPDELEVAR